MPIIDADAHVDEDEATWSYASEGERALMPVTVEKTTEGESGRYWFVDGRLRERKRRNDEVTGTTEATRQLMDVPARLRHMDALGVDVQVIYPTFFLRTPTDRPEIELALCRSYNRWLADRCAASGGRLRWVAVLPTLTMDETVREIRFARDNGAAAVFKRGIECGERPAGNCC